MKNITYREDNIVRIHLEEYKALREEMLKKIEFEHQLLNYTILIPSAFLTILNSNLITGDHAILILISPIIFYALGLVYAFTDYTIVNIAVYINTILRPALLSLFDNKELLGYENYVFSQRTKLEGSFVGRLYSVAKTVIVVIGPVIIIVYFITKWGLYSLSFTECALLTFDILMVGVSIIFRLNSWELQWQTISNETIKKR